MSDFKVLTYDAVQVGETFVSNDHLITPEDIETYAFAVDDYHTWFVEESPFGGPIAHPTLMANQALHLRHSKYIVHAGLHAKMAFQFLRPLRVGMRVRSRGTIGCCQFGGTIRTMRVRSRGTIIDKYIRRDKKYMVTEFVTTDEDNGLEVMRGQFTQMIIEPPGHDNEERRP